MHTLTLAHLAIFYKLHLTGHLHMTGVISLKNSPNDIIDAMSY
ncbi:MAG: hypothetical protein NTV68_00745 [Methanomicrobiales archaeon]|nr:hypothetical protein [Methanomicrobiales archaeon]